MDAFSAFVFVFSEDKRPTWSVAFDPDLPRKHVPSVTGNSIIDIHLQTSCMKWIILSVSSIITRFLTTVSLKTNYGKYYKQVSFFATQLAQHGNYRSEWRSNACFSLIVEIVSVLIERSAAAESVTILEVSVMLNNGVEYDYQDLLNLEFDGGVLLPQHMHVFAAPLWDWSDIKFEARKPNFTRHFVGHMESLLCSVPGCNSHNFNLFAFLSHIHGSVPQPDDAKVLVERYLFLASDWVRVHSYSQATSKCEQDRYFVASWGIRTSFCFRFCNFVGQGSVPILHVNTGGVISPRLQIWSSLIN